jgi:hypothetical protein
VDRTVLRVGLSGDTAHLVERLFEPDAQELVRALLEEDCGANLPLWADQDEQGLERIRFAVLKLSQGDLNKLGQWIEDAKRDWRDVLMAAGFGRSLTAHEEWRDSILNPSAS